MILFHLSKLIERFFDAMEIRRERRVERRERKRQMRRRREACR